MKQKPGRESREPRESSLASGWTVAGEPAVVGDPGAARVDASTVAVGAPRVPGAPGTESRVDVDVDVDADVDADVDVSGSRARGSDIDAIGAEASERAQISNAALVVLGVFGGLYLLYTWGWFIVAQAYSGNNSVTAAGSGIIGGVLQQIVFWAAPLAAPLWFFTALVFGRGGRTKLLTIVLIVGAVVLVPLPMLIARGA